jgi:hypothetical protein
MARGFRSICQRGGRSHIFASTALHVRYLAGSTSPSESRGRQIFPENLSSSGGGTIRSIRTRHRSFRRIPSRRRRRARWTYAPRGHRLACRTRRARTARSPAPAAARRAPPGAGSGAGDQRRASERTGAAGARGPRRARRSHPTRQAYACRRSPRTVSRPLGCQPPRRARAQQRSDRSPDPERAAVRARTLPASPARRPCRALSPLARAGTPFHSAVCFSPPRFFFVPSQGLRRDTVPIGS